ncbi:MAG TPA: PadR family transcriptional regulator [Streptosporangiaceae bacterium]
MPDPGARQLRLSDWLVLCVVCEQPTHGFAVAGLFSHDGSLGRVWQVSKPAIYAAMTRLERLGLVQMIGEQHTSQGPARSLVEATPAGQTAAREWLRAPVRHGRDVRSELLIKLALLDRAGADPWDLLSEQRHKLSPLAAALADRAHATTGIEHTLALWRHKTMSATIQFLDDMTRQTEPGSSGVTERVSAGDEARPW